MDFGRTDLHEFSRLQDTQQAHLRRQRELCDFVEENGAAVGLLEVPFAGVRGACEGPFLMAKEFRVDGAFRDGAAVDGHVRTVLSRTELMDDARHGLLSGAAFPEHKNADVRGGHLRGDRQGAVECGRIPDHPKPSLDCPYIHAQLSAGSSVTSPIKVTGVQSKVFTFTYSPGFKSPLGNTTTVLCVVRPKNWSSRFLLVPSMRTRCT